MKEKTHILSLDGGTHGYTYLYCLRELEEDNPGFLTETDIFTGSSFGGFASLYFARHIQSLEKGECALELIEGCIEFMRKLLAFEPDEAAFARFLNGAESMFDHDRMERVLKDPKHLGEACLGELHRRVIIITYGTKNPSWAPKVYDSLLAEDQPIRASEVGLEAASLPIILPIRNGLANGSCGGTNGSMHALTRVVGRDSDIDLDDVVLLSFGGDAGSSSLADFPTPWDARGAVPEKPSLEAILQPKPQDAQLFGMLKQRIDSLWDELREAMADQESEDVMKSRCGFSLMPSNATEPVTTANGSTKWGWRQWLGYSASPLFFYQVINNNQALETAVQTKLLLGERTLRVAPMALLSYGQIFFMTFFAKPAARALITSVAELTAELWAEPETSERYQFSPNIEQTEQFVDRYWMIDTYHRCLQREERDSGWRRKRTHPPLGQVDAYM